MDKKLIILIHYCKHVDFEVNVVKSKLMRLNLPCSCQLLRAPYIWDGLLQKIMAKTSLWRIGSGTPSNWHDEASLASPKMPRDWKPSIVASLHLRRILRICLSGRIGREWRLTRFDRVEHTILRRKLRWIGHTRRKTNDIVKDTLESWNARSQTGSGRDGDVSTCHDGIQIVYIQIANIWN